MTALDRLTLPTTGATISPTEHSSGMLSVLGQGTQEDLVQDNVTAGAEGEESSYDWTRGLVRIPAGTQVK